MTADHVAASTAAPATPVRTSASTATATAGDHSYPNGHLGHLTAQQEDAFARFKAVVEEKGLYKPGPPASHDDPLLL